MNNTRIDWCDSTWNPVTGCKGGCDYCYARSIANRFGGWTTGGVKTTQNFFSDPPVLDSPLLLERKSGKAVKAPYPFAFTPTFHRYRLEEPLKKRKGQNIFVGSMADLFGRWVPTKWIVEVLDICREAPQHNYLFLTKFPVCGTGSPGPAPARGKLLVRSDDHQREADEKSGGLHRPAPAGSEVLLQHGASDGGCSQK